MRVRMPGTPYVFNITYIKQSNGSLNDYTNCTLTSEDPNTRTLTLYIKGKGTRSLKTCLIVKFNNLTVMY